MDKTIICKVDIFAVKQQVFLSPEEKVDIDLEELASAIPALCYSNNTYKVHLYGNENYIDGLINDIKLVNSRYTNQNIEIEVN